MGIQRKFLWGGLIEAQKINWISWGHICLQKVEGGLGVKNLKVFNMSLLAKWQWRMLNGKEAIWNKLMDFRYQKLQQFSTFQMTSNTSSIWWRDIIKATYASKSETGWFEEMVERKAGEEELCFSGKKSGWEGYH